MEQYAQIIGWIGTVCIVGAYALVSAKKVSGDSMTYQAVNLLGAIGVGVNVYYQAAWPAFALQVVWGGDRDCNDSSPTIKSEHE